jgi:ferredoxin-NADP reductase
VVAIRRETARAKTFRMRLPDAFDFAPGQHLVVRLRAPDGYTAQRSYSLASTPDGAREVELTVERLDEGEVSGYLHDVVEVGDSLEVRGPIGGYFVWDGRGRALLVGGGAGLVPLMSMLRTARVQGASGLVRLVVSVRTPGDLLYASELPGPEVTVVYTRAVPAGWPRPPARLTAADLPDVDDTGETTAFVCGSAGFCDAVSDLLIGRGHPVDKIRTERFGPTG